MVLGIYIHIPFCVSKCAYCDFYSLATPELADSYVKKILSEINRWGSALNCPADTLYFGGGTPNLVKPENIKAIIDKCKEQFSLKDAEITLEANPGDDLDDYFKAVAKAGVNRISLGLQSADDEELKILSRRHKRQDVLRAVESAKNAGIDNISLDVMLGIPNQTENSLNNTLDFALSLEPSHISCYMLSLEKGTPLYKNQKLYNIPNEEKTADLYLFTTKKLRKNGFERYEISNFSRDNIISKHNTKYWTGQDYLGLGPSAHSLIKGRRFYYDRNLTEYINNPTEIFEDYGGTVEEKIMLNLRLATGLSLSELKKDFPDQISTLAEERIIKKATLFNKGGLVDFKGNIISLTDKGAVVSNSIIAEFLYCLD